MRQKNITYFLGAGASAEALPIIDSLPERMLTLGNRIRTVGMNDPYIQFFSSHLITLSGFAKDFVTIDTYARKLFLTNDIVKLKELKVTMSAFFVLEQFCYSSLDPKSTDTNIDKRYISLVSAYLEKSGSSIQLPQNLNFISWNYDLQLELSIAKFILDKEKLKGQELTTFNCFPREEKIVEYPKIVHLNGIAGLNLSQNINSLISDSLPNANLTDALTLMAPFFQAPYSPGSLADPAFTFSWEDNTISSQSQKFAREILASTEILVIIGYSFPVFNRKTDKLLFKGISEHTKIYYQDPRADSSTLANIFGLTESLIVPIQSINNFVVPIEF